MKKAYDHRCGIVFVASAVFRRGRRRPDLCRGRQVPGLPQDGKAGQAAYPIWEASKHAQSFNILKTETAKTEAGEQVPAQQSPACLKCHAPLHEKAKDISVEGITCEVCHGPGGLYRKLNVMVSREASVKNGLVVYASKDAIKAHCLTCHENAHGIKWDFDKSWEAVKHYRPGK